VDASHGKIGNPVDSVLLFCSHYDPTTGKYSLLITRVLFLGALLTVVLLAAFLMILFRGGSKAQARAFATGKSLRAER
jgi:protein SCO1/2